MPDAAGTIWALSDPTQTGAAALTDQYGYRQFGESQQVTGAWRYTSRRVDAETGLYYYRARMYSPAQGRFLQPDPIGLQGGPNLYGYVGNDPLDYTDPSGLFLQDAGNEMAAGAYNLLPSSDTARGLGLIAGGVVTGAAGTAMMGGGDLMLHIGCQNVLVLVLPQINTPIFARLAALGSKVARLGPAWPRTGSHLAPVGPATIALRQHQV